MRLELLRNTQSKSKDVYDYLNTIFDKSLISIAFYTFSQPDFIVF